MVQLKYYGDDRDYFKYDLVSAVLEESGIDSYGFIPMLTEHRYDNEGNIALKSSTCKSKELLTFILSHSKPDLNNWEQWLKRYTSSYATVQPINSTYISNRKRNEYWSKFQQVISMPESLIFFDPDTGVQAGRKTPIKVEEYEKYILNEEMPHLLKSLSETSAFVIYQHLQRDRKKHEADIARKIEAISNMDAGTRISVYREKDLAFLFIAKSNEIHKTIRYALKTYLNQSTASPKGIHHNA